jgi:hypothetical protein
MAENPYKAPNASLEVTTPEKVDQAIAKKIKNAWIAGLISAGITLVLVLVAVLGGISIAGVDAWAFGDLAIVLALTYGVYRKSRVCAILLFGFFVLNKAVMWGTAGNVSGLPLALVFMWFYGQGIVGTFQYHKLQRKDEGAA